MNTHSQFGTHKISIIFWIFLCVSIPATVLLVGYAAGYRLELHNRQLIELSGIAVDTVQKGVTIQIDGASKTERTPFIVSIAPGTHDVRLHKDDSVDWHKTVTGEPGKSMIFSGVILFSSTPVVQTADPNLVTMRAADIEPAGPVVQDYYRTNGWSGTGQMQTVQGPRWLLIDRAANQSFLLQRLTEFTDNQRIAGTVTAASWNNDVLLFTTNQYELWTYDASTQSRELLLRQSTPLSSIAWHPDGQYIFYGDQSGIYAMELDSRDQRQVWQLSTIANPQQFGISTNGTVLQFTDSTGQQAQVLLYEKN